MTRWYTHTGEEASIAAVNGLPSILEADSVKALPPAGDADTLSTPPASVLDEIRRLADGMNARTWKKNRDAILKAADQAGGKVKKKKARRKKPARS